MLHAEGMSVIETPVLAGANHSPISVLTQPRPILEERASEI